MRKSILMMIVGMLVMIAIIPMVMFGKYGFCLGCIFGLLMFLGGIALLITGIISLVGSLKKDDSGVEAESDKMSVSSLIEPFFWVKDAIVRILRNRRRSSAMLSGIILSSLVIGSVFIFTEAMQEDFYNDFVKEITFETSFGIKEEGNESDLWNLANQIKDDNRVESCTVLCGSHLPSEWGDMNYDEGTKTDFNFGGTFPVYETSSAEQKTRSELEAEPIFVRENFTETSIYDKLIRDGLEGSFDLDPETNRTVIPRSLANKMFLEVGDTIEEMEISLEIHTWSEDPANPVRDEGIYSLKLRNVSVVGIYSDESRDEESDSFFFNTEILEIYKPSMISKMEEIHLFILAVKIDPSEFSTGNMQELSKQIDGLVMDIERESDGKVEGVNNIGGLVFMLNIIRYVLIVVDFILILPVVILSIYFLIFGLDLSLEERKREVAILKVQGANSKQIFKMISMESFMLFVIGLTVGYFLSILTGWVIMSSIGFMTFDLSYSYLQEFFGFHKGALAASSLIVGLIVLISVFIKARRFIRQEVSEGVQRMRKNQMNVILFSISFPLLLFGSICAIKNILSAVLDFNSIGGVKLSLGEGWDIFLFGIIGTLSLWVGGALSGPTIAQWMALRTEKLFLKLFFLKDVSLIIRSGLRRRGDTAKLVLIIILTLSVATLASVQGLTDQKNSERTLEYEIGADYQVFLSSRSDNTSILESVDGVKEVMAIPSENILLYSRETTIYGIKADEATFLAWHSDSFKDMSADEAVNKLEKRSGENGVFFGKDLAEDMGISKGETFDITIPISNPIPGLEEVRVMKAVLLGTFDHFPSALGSSSIVCDHSTLLRIRYLKNDHRIDIERSVPVIAEDVDPSYTDHSPDHGFHSNFFFFNISVSDTVDVENVFINWSHDDMGENVSLFYRGGYFYGEALLNKSLNSMNYTIFIKDSHGNINCSSWQYVRVYNIYYPNRLYDLSPDAGIGAQTYEFNISLGENIRIESAFINWDHGARNGNQTLAFRNGYFTGSILLDDSTDDLVYTLTMIDPEQDLNATLYLLDRESEVDPAVVRQGLDRIIYVMSYRDLSREKEDIVDQINFGIPGLLTMMFVASLIAVFTSAFAFSSIIIKRRMREFAVLQTVGASRWQVYKIAIGENALVMFVSVVLGLLVGIGLSYQMNGFFEVLGSLLGIGSGSLDRIVFFPWSIILSISGAIFIGMLLAVAVSAVSAARQNLAVSTRVV